MAGYNNRRLTTQQKQQVPETSGISESDMTSQQFYYSPGRFLLTMLAIAWSAFAHPFSSTVIDLASGETRHDGQDDEA